MARGRRETARSLAGALAAPRQLLPVDTNPLGTTRGEPDRVGGARWELPGGFAFLRLDGRVEWEGGPLHDPERARVEWPADGPTSTIPLHAAFTAGPSLSLRDKAAVLDHLAGDPEAASRLAEAMDGRRLLGSTMVWWAPDTRDTGVDRLEEGEFPEGFRPWGHPLFTSRTIPTEATGPLYQLRLMPGMPALWCALEVGGPDSDEVISPAGAKLMPVHIERDAQTPAGVRDVITCDVFWSDTDA